MSLKKDLVLDAITPAEGTNCKYTWKLDDPQYKVNLQKVKDNQLIIFKSNLNRLNSTNSTNEKEYEVSVVTTCEPQVEKSIIYKFKIKKKIIRDKIQGFDIDKSFVDNKI